MKIVTFGNETGTILSEKSIDNLYINIDYTLNSVISSLSNPLKVLKEEIFPEGYSNQTILLNELNKNFVNNIEEISKTNNYIIIDLLDERYNLLKYQDSIVLDSWKIRSTNLIKENDFIQLNRNNVPIDEWKVYCNKFISLLNKYFPKRVIINEMYMSVQVKKDNNFYEIDNLESINKINSQLKEYYLYLKRSLDEPKIISIIGNDYLDSSYNLNNPAKKNDLYNSELINQTCQIVKHNFEYKVAVIITSYNIENYIGESINSVLGQTLSDVQVIVVDDGSTDKTQSIIEELGKDKLNIKYKFIQNTGSPSQPRNEGMQMADAEYIMFLDGDDYLALDACENLYKKAIGEKSDITIGKMISFTGNKFFPSSSVNLRFKERYELVKGIVGSKELSIFRDPILYLFPSSCSKLFKSELLNGSTFDKNIKYGEDLLFSMECFLNSKKTIITDDIVYYYRGKQDGHTVSTTQERSIKNLNDLNQVTHRLHQLFSNKERFFSNKKVFDKKLDYYRMLEANQHIGQLMSYPKEERFNAAKLIKETLLKDVIDKQKIQIFSIINYLKLSLVLDEKYDELLTLCNLLEKVTMYDHMGEYPFKIVKMNDGVYWIFNHKKNAVRINITHHVTTNKLVNHLVDIDFKNNEMVIEGIAYINNIPITNRGDIRHEIILRNRESKLEYKYKPLFLENNKYSTSIYKYGMGGYKIKVGFKEQLPLGVYDAFIKSTFHGVEKEIPLGGMNNKFIYKAKNYFTSNNKEHFEISPIVKNRNRFTIFYKKLDNSFEYIKRRLKSNIRQKQFSLKQIKNNKYLSKDRKIKLAFSTLSEDIASYFFRNKEIWLVGEKLGKSANDTGYWFFKYCRENIPDKNVYYVIDKNSPDYSRVREFGNIINYYSVKHILYSMFAKYVFSSDNVNILLPSNIKHLRRANRVFIQHGIILPGRVENVYHSNKDINDFILSSSDFEKNILMNHFGYNDHEILNVGLPRFDTLRNNIKEKRIMLTFTWRKDIQDISQLKESTYFKSIKSLINNERLINLLQNNNIKLDICLHPRTCELLGDAGFKLLIGDNQTKNIEIHDFNNIDVRVLIERSFLLLTDYSSISFDYVYLNKPVINYLFQNNTPISEENIADTLPGFVVFDEEQVITSLEDVILNKKVLKKVKKEKYIKYHDGQNCNRLVNYILKNS
jgi:glycosyltransferase involved in cell wall biosynthesis/CDP-glycerol glycerophosphotransferase (TagB/SpsB family)